MSQPTPLETVTDYVQTIESILESRRDTRLLSQIKIYNNSLLPLWCSCSPPLQQVVAHYAEHFDLGALADRVLHPLELNEPVPLDALRSCSDLDVQWCSWAVEHAPQAIVRYWSALPHNAYTDDLLYDTRRQVIAALLRTDQAAIATVCDELVDHFVREEQLSGNMGLPRARVQEVVYVL